jgi:4-hydroxybenzoate polyprenyltransferase
VDVDGTLLRTDLLWEGLVQLCVRSPLQLIGLLPAAMRGRAALKRYVAATSNLPLDRLPQLSATKALIDEARAGGRQVVLASGADEIQVRALGKTLDADLMFASDGRVNLTSETKLAFLKAHFTEFDYVGNGADDLGLWKAARRAVAVNVRPPDLRRARRIRPDLTVLEKRPTIPWHAWFRALRAHQWAKNALLFLPALAAHLGGNSALLIPLMAAFFAFSFLASAGYLLNDLADLQNDRLHPTKHRRPVAAGQLSIPATIGGTGALLGLAVLIAVQLSIGFQAVLGVYFGLTIAYSAGLKRIAVLDVIVLATLYTARVVAGAVVVDVQLSRWFIAFSIFLFLSLALVKRVNELQARSAQDATGIPGRGYLAADLSVLRTLGLAAAGASTLVYCLYITGPEVTLLYRHPDLLWPGLPLLLYWEARIWLLTARRRFSEDPLVFALRDWPSYIVLGAFLLFVWLAA